MGKNITLVGGNGDGQTTKVANQIIVALTIEAVGEALLFASRAGADPAKVRQALMGGFASSRILEIHGERMIKRTFDPGFRIELHQKDLNLALQGARALSLSLPNTATTQELFNAAAALGGKGWDHSGLVRVLEHLAGHAVARSRTVPRLAFAGEGVRAGGGVPGKPSSAQVVVRLLVAVGFDRFRLIVGIEDHIGKSTYITIIAPPPGSKHRVQAMRAFARWRLRLRERLRTEVSCTPEKMICSIVCLSTFAIICNDL